MECIGGFILFFLGKSLAYCVDKICCGSEENAENSEIEGNNQENNQVEIKELNKKMSIYKKITGKLSGDIIEYSPLIAQNIPEQTGFFREPQQEIEMTISGIEELSTDSESDSESDSDSDDSTGTFMTANSIDEKIEE